MDSKARLWEADLMEHLTFNRYEYEPLRNKTSKRIVLSCALKSFSAKNRFIIQHMSCSRQL